MNVELLEQARSRIPSVSVLVNMVSQRVRQLNMGMRPLIKPLGPDEDRLNLVLREIAEGKLIAEVDFDALARSQMLE